MVVFARAGSVDMLPETDFNIFRAFVVDDDSLFPGYALQIGMVLRERKALAHALLMRI